MSPGTADAVVQAPYFESPAQCGVSWAIWKQRGRVVGQGPEGGASPGQSTTGSLVTPFVYLLAEVSAGHDTRERM